MTITDDAAALIAHGPQRVTGGPAFDGNGRYRLRLPGDAAPKGRTRVTSFIKELDDGQGLIDWKATATMVGAMRHPGIHAKWAALFARSTDPWYVDNGALKGDCKALVEESAKAGGAEDRAEVGTALHTMLELIARGEEPHLLERYAPDVAAFRAALVEAQVVAIPEWVEVTVYVPDWDLVGTFDGLFGDNVARAVRIGDYKTETDTKFKALPHAAQLAAYARATHRIVWPEDPEDVVELVELPVFDTDTGLIFHIPAGEGRCELHEVDLALGREALDVAARMRDLGNRNKRKHNGGFMRPRTIIAAPTPADGAQVGAELAGHLSSDVGTCVEVGALPDPDVNVAHHQSPEGPGSAPPPTDLEDALLVSLESIATSTLKARLADIGEGSSLGAALMGRWPIDKRLIDPWTPEETALVADLIAELDIEGPDADADEVASVGARFAALDYRAQGLVQAWVGNAARAAREGKGRGVELGGGNTTRRRVDLAYVAIAATHLDVYALERMTSEVIPGAHFDRRAGLGLGHYLAIATWQDAARLRELFTAAAVLSGRLTADDGRHDDEVPTQPRKSKPTEGNPA